MLNVALGNVESAERASSEAKTASRRSQMQCAAAGCPRKLKADGSSLDQCGGCKRCYYCSKACHPADWKAGHKAECFFIPPASIASADRTGGGSTDSTAAGLSSTAAADHSGAGAGVGGGGLQRYTLTPAAAIPGEVATGQNLKD